MTNSQNPLHSIIRRYKRLSRQTKIVEPLGLEALHPFVGYRSERRAGGRLHLEVADPIAIGSNFVLVSDKFHEHGLGSGILIEFVDDIHLKAGDSIWLTPRQMLIQGD